MPHLSPMFWLLIYILMLTQLMIIMSFLYFFFFFYNKNLMPNKFVYPISLWIWKW